MVSDTTVRPLGRRATRTASDIAIGVSLSRWRWSGGGVAACVGADAGPDLGQVGGGHGITLFPAIQAGEGRRPGGGAAGGWGRGGGRAAGSASDRSGASTE